MADNLILHNLELAYRWMNLVFFIIAFFLLSYVIGYKLRFRVDPAGYVILVTQFLVMAIRVFLKEDNAEYQPILLLAGYLIDESTLFFFVFEMQFIYLKVSSSTLEEYKARRTKFWRIRAVTIGILLLIELPLGCVAMALSKQDNRKDYYNFILASMIITRVFKFFNNTYVYV